MSVYVIILNVLRSKGVLTDSDLNLLTVADNNCCDTLVDMEKFVLKNYSFR